MDSEKSHKPVSLTIIAVLFLVGGAQAALEMIISMMNDFFNFHLGVLGIFIGIGLLNLRPGWRICALVFIWIGLIGLPVIAAIFISVGGPLDLNFFGQPIGQAPVGFGIAVAVVAFLFLIWEYRVLPRPDVKKLFGLEIRELLDPSS